MSDVTLANQIFSNVKHHTMRFLLPYRVFHLKEVFLIIKFATYFEGSGVHDKLIKTF